MSFDYLQVPKLCYRLSLPETSPEEQARISKQLSAIFSQYNATNKFYDTVFRHTQEQVNNEAPQLIQQLESYFPGIHEGEELDIDRIRRVIPLYFVSLDFSKLSQFLKKLLLLDSSNLVEMLCYSYLCNIHRFWYKDIAVVNAEEEESFESLLENLDNTYKRIVVNVKSNTNELSDRVTLFNYLNNFKMMRLGTLAMGFDRVQDLGFLEEFLTSYLIQFVLTTPFNKLVIDDELSEYVEDTELYKYTQSLREGNVQVRFPIESLHNVKYILPSWGVQKFSTYIKLIMNFKLFLSLMSYTSKITTTRLLELIGDEFDTNLYIMLIGSLDLQKVGIGYENGVFYNNNTEVDNLQQDIDELNMQLSRDLLSLILGAGLVKKFVE